MGGVVAVKLQGDEPWITLPPCTWFGLHKDSIDIATADTGRDGEIRHLGSIGGDLASLDKALRKLVSRGHRLHVI